MPADDCFNNTNNTAQRTKDFLIMYFFQKLLLVITFVNIIIKVITVLLVLLKQSSAGICNSCIWSTQNNIT